MVRVYVVALRKESVDRNTSTEPKKQSKGVALRKESVDRNILPMTDELATECRSPQGERG